MMSFLYLASIETVQKDHQVLHKEKENNKEKSISTALEQNSDKNSDEKFPRYRPLE